MTLPNFLIIGAQRSGTTWLARCLGKHPGVFMAERKELHFFDSVTLPDQSEYERNFAGANGARAIGEATPRYMYDDRALERIEELLPDVRVIAILREPASRAYSHYWLNRARGEESLSFEDAITQEEERIGRSREERIRYSYVDRGRYASQLKPYFEHFGVERVHVSLLEDFRAAAPLEFAKVCRFLGVDPLIQVPQLEARVNGYKEFRSLRVRKLLQYVPRNRVGSAVRRRMSRWNGRVSSYPPMTATTQTLIRSLLEDEVRQLEALLSRDLYLWVAT